MKEDLRAELEKRGIEIDESELKTEFTRSDWIKGIIFMVWLAVSVVLCFFSFAFIMEIFGGIFLYSTIQRIDMNKKPHASHIAVAVCCFIGFICLLIYQLSGKESIKDIAMSLVVTAFMLFAMSIGVYVLLRATVGRYKLHKRCSQRVDAVCTKAEEKFQTIKNKLRRGYSLIYEIEFDGRTIELREEIYPNGSRTVGEIRELFVNPENPSEFVDPTTPEYIGDDISTGIFFIVVPLIMLIPVLALTFHNLKQL